MTKCEYCGKKISHFGKWVPIGTNKEMHSECYTKCMKESPEKILEYQGTTQDEVRKKYDEIIAKAPKIKCPFCEQWFPKLTDEQYRQSAELNVLKWAIVPAWGLAGSLKNKPFIECPHCKMKIMQG